MSSNYIFKPPPPAPPSAQQGFNNDSSRGRGGRPGYRGAGRGGGRGRGGSRGGFNSQQRYAADHQHRNNPMRRPDRDQQTGAGNPAFSNPQSSGGRGAALPARPQPRPEGISNPALPAFGSVQDGLALFPTPGQIKNDIYGAAYTTSHADSPPSKRRKVEGEVDEDDEDEERKLAAAAGISGEAVPIYGTNIVLASPADIEMWIAERKSRWPTAARIEEKKRMQMEARQRHSQPRPSRSNDEPFNPEASSKVSGKGGGQAKDDAGVDAESDSDDAPAEESSKVQVPLKVPPPQRAKKPERPLCSTFLREGRCKFGHRCRYSHDRSAVKAAREKEEEKRKLKPLYIRLLEQQKQEEDRIAVQAIKFLFDQGKLGTLDSSS